MKVFVCYRRIPYEGCSEPITAFLEESSAIEWCKSQEESRKSRFYEYYEYEEMEVQE